LTFLQLHSKDESASALLRYFGGFLSPAGGGFVTPPLGAFLGGFFSVVAPGVGAGAPPAVELPRPWVGSAS